MREDDVYVIATARRESAGRESVAELQSSEGRGNIEFHQLDITNGASIAALADFIRNQKGGKLDILVNNAGMAFKVGRSVGSDDVDDVALLIESLRRRLAGLPSWRPSGECPLQAFTPSQTRQP